MAFGSRARRRARRAPIVPFEEVNWKSSPRAAAPSTTKVTPASASVQKVAPFSPPPPPAETPQYTPEPVPQTVFNPASEDVPRGTAREIISWVGNDSERAARALEREMDSPHPRSTLVDTLYNLI